MTDWSRSPLAAKMLAALEADTSWCDDFGEATLRETARRTAVICANVTDRPPEERLVEQMAEALSVCSEMLNGRDSMVDAIAGGEGPVTKSPLTAKVDKAMQAWRQWKFG